MRRQWQHHPVSVTRRSPPDGHAVVLLHPSNYCLPFCDLLHACAACVPVLQEYSAVYVASQRLEQLLELMANDGDTRPMVVTSRDRLDIVMGLLASQVGDDEHNTTACNLLHG